MTTGRAETFADGVLAIAATLLILNVGSNLPAATHATQGLGHELIQSWPTFGWRWISTSSSYKARSRRGNVASTC